MEANLKEEWSKSTLGHFGDDEETKTPYNVYIYPNLLEQKFVDSLRNDINSSVKLKPKDNDLYKFKQSKDFKTEIPAKKLTPLLHEFIDLMLGQIRLQLEKATGLKLSDKNFDITASRYDTGDYLLCHNDDIRDNVKHHGRSLAFIYYLNSRPWTKEDGGALVLYDSDDSGEPVSINNSIWPRPNTLIAFKTTPVSWHSVQEVYCSNDFRLSINGWFHTDLTSKVVNLDKTIEPCPFAISRPIVVDDRIEKFFKESFNQDYLMERTCRIIRKRFKRKSEINLTNFLVKEKFDEISAALKKATEKEDNLVHIGPYNKRNYKRLEMETLPPVCKDLYDAFQSELFFMLLSRITGLDLQPPSIKTDEDESSDEDESEDDDDDDDDDDDEDEDEESESDSDSDSDSDEEEDSEDESDEGKKDKGGKNPQQKAKQSKVASKTSSPTKVDTASVPQKDVEAGGKGLDLSLAGGPKGYIRKPKEQLDKSSTSPQKESSKKQPEDKPTTSKPLADKPVDLVPRKRRKTSDPLARIEFRHLESGSYTLIHDHGFELGEKSALDVILHFNHDFKVNFDQGGYISYIDGAPDDDLHDMDYELLTVEPKSNCLSLVYRCDEGTCRFLKHISKTHKSNYQDLYCVYYEKPDDLPSC